MNSFTSRMFGLIMTIALLSTGSIVAAADRPYAEGSVLDVTSIRTQDGHFDDYVEWLAGPWKQFMEEQKKAGVIVDYNVYSAYPRRPGDADLYLVTVYRDMAALDDLNAKTDAITEKVFGSPQQANAGTAARGEIRTVLGAEIIRELLLR